MTFETPTAISFNDLQWIVETDHPENEGETRLYGPFSDADLALALWYVRIERFSYSKHLAS